MTKVIMELIIYQTLLHVAVFLYGLGRPQANTVACVVENLLLRLVQRMVALLFYCAPPREAENPRLVLMMEPHPHPPKCWG